MPNDILHEISIAGFKSIASINLKLRPINVLIGANGSGKSNFLGAFEFLHEIGAGRLREYVVNAGGAEEVLHFGSRSTEKIGLRVSLSHPSDPQFSSTVYELTLKVATGIDRLFPSNEQIRLGILATSLIEWQQAGQLEAGISNPESEDMHTRAFRRQLDLWQPYHLADTSFMHKTAKVDDKFLLRRDGSNLPAVLYDVREQFPDFYIRIVRTIQQVAPFFDTFELNPEGRDDSQSIRLLWRHKRSDQHYNASSLSAGTLRFIALATLFLQPRKWQSIILVDEPELGLHPYAIEVLAALIRQASSHTQVIVSTQSSLLLDHFEPEDVLVADRVGGGMQLTRLDSARLAKWLEDYSLGQLWEKNEFGGRPVPG